jgi:hypothetical protein
VMTIIIIIIMMMKTLLLLLLLWYNNSNTDIYKLKTLNNKSLEKYFILVEGIETEIR